VNVGFIQCSGSGSAWIRIDFVLLDPDPDRESKNDPQKQKNVEIHV
jgi:hypothetical protein